MHKGVPHIDENTYFSAHTCTWACTIKVKCKWDKYYDKKFLQLSVSNKELCLHHLSASEITAKTESSGLLPGKKEQHNFIPKLQR